MSNIQYHTKIDQIIQYPYILIFNELINNLYLFQVICRGIMIYRSILFYKEIKIRKKLFFYPNETDYNSS